MYMIMVGGRVQVLTNNRSKAKEHLALTMLVNTPKADIVRACELFGNGTSVTIGTVAAIAR
jgi:hypothetical protein